MTTKQLEQLSREITQGDFVVDDQHIVGPEEMSNSLLLDKGSSREWVAVGLNDEDGFAECVAYCHPMNALAISLVPQLIKEVLELRGSLEFLTNSLKPGNNVSVQMLADELNKARSLLSKAE